jgi:PIN domain nuclease of toxin-antitoxin system
LGGRSKSQGRKKLNPRFLLDTHIAIRWRGAPKKLSREQDRVLRDVDKTGEPIAISAITLLEMAVLLGDGRTQTVIPMEGLFTEFDTNPAIQIIPLTAEIAAEVAALGGSLRDPADRAIVATARVRRLKLITSDQRIIDSGLVPVVG